MQDRPQTDGLAGTVNAVVAAGEDVVLIDQVGDGRVRIPGGEVGAAPAAGGGIISEQSGVVADRQIVDLFAAEQLLPGA